MKRATDSAKVRAEARDKRLAEQKAIVEAQLDGYVAEYGEKIDAWKLLDTKSQIATATAGIFLGGAFAILRVPNLKLDELEKPLLVIALGALVASVLCGLRALELRKVSSPPRGSAFAKSFGEFYATDEFAFGGTGMQERLALFMHDQMRLWRKAIDVLALSLKSKSRWTKAAQRLLALGALIFAALSLIQVCR